MGRELIGPTAQAANTASPLGDGGFSLLELVVVTAMMSILAVGATLSVGMSRREAVATDQRHFRDTFETARALAIRERGKRGLRVTPQGMTVTRHGPDGWTTRETERPWSGRISLYSRSGGPAGPIPEIVLLPNGRSTAFEITFTADGEVAQVCRTDGWSRLLCE